MPAGTRIVPFYDQLNLVEKAVHTVEKSLLGGAGDRGPRCARSPASPM